MAAEKNGKDGKRPPGRSPGRPRDPANDAAILAAARRILAARGSKALTFEEITRETGIARASIYRRWPNKAHLLAAIANDSGETLPDVLEDAGYVAEIEALLAMVDRHYGRKHVAAAAVGLLVAWRDDPSLRQKLGGGVEEGVRQSFRAILARGKARGEVRADVDSDALFDLLVGAVMYNRLFSSLAGRRHDLAPVREIVLRGTLA